MPGVLDVISQAWSWLKAHSVDLAMINAHWLLHSVQVSVNDDAGFAAGSTTGRKLSVATKVRRVFTMASGDLGPHTSMFSGMGMTKGHRTGMLYEIFQSAWVKDVVSKVAAGSDDSLSRGGSSIISG